MMTGKFWLYGIAIFIGWLPSIGLKRKPPVLMGDEAYYACVPIEMGERGDWLVPYFNGSPRYKKPPLQYWFVALSYRLFGISEWSARFPSLCAVFLTALSLLWFGKKRGALPTGLLAATFFLLSPMTVSLGNWAAPEATLTFFIAVATFMGLWAIEGASPTFWIISGIAMGAGVLTKGAPGFVLPSLLLFPLALVRWGRQRDKGALRGFFVALVTASLFALPWFLFISLREGGAFWEVFWVREHLRRVAEPLEGHRGPIWFYLPLLWLAFFPWSIRLPAASGKALRDGPEIDRWLAVWGWGIIVLFSLVATKLPHYIFPTLPAFAWLTARQWERIPTRPESLVALAFLFPVLILTVKGVSWLPEAYATFLRRNGFSLGDGEGLTVLIAARSLAVGFWGASLLVALGVVAEGWGKVREGGGKGLSVLGGSFLTIFLFLSGQSFLSVADGRSAVSVWGKASVQATYGSDTEWVVFYGRRPVLRLRDERTLHSFLTRYPDGAILTRIDFAPTLRRFGLSLSRFGIWCIGRKE